MSGYVSVRASALCSNTHGSYLLLQSGVLKSHRMDIHVRVCICEPSVRASAPIHTVPTSYYRPVALKSHRMDIHVTVCICEGICSNTHGSYLLLQVRLKLTVDEYSGQGMYL